jgi:hypothetical protein
MASSHSRAGTYEPMRVLYEAIRFGSEIASALASNVLPYVPEFASALALSSNFLTYLSRNHMEHMLQASIKCAYSLNREN